MYHSWKKGIPTNIFRDQRIGDLIVMDEIDSAIQETVDRERRIQKAMESLGRL